MSCQEVATARDSLDNREAGLADRIGWEVDTDSSVLEEMEGELLSCLDLRYLEKKGAGCRKFG